MSLTLNYVATACDELGISYRFVDDNRAVVLIGPEDRLLINTNLGVLTDAEWMMFRDKYYCFKLFGARKYFPKTRAYIDPLAGNNYAEFVTFSCLEDIADDVCSQFELPVIIKRNSGTRGRNVFLCHERAKILKALAKIFSRRQLEYDHVALAQEYIQPVGEYRLVVFESILQFSYVKPHHKPEFGGVIKPELVTDTDKVARLGKLVAGLSEHYPLVYSGLDVVETVGGEFKVIEINGSPSYAAYIRACGDEQVKRLMLKVVRRLCGQ